MSESVTTSPICPGERALFPNAGGVHYLRVVFNVYWCGAYPSTEVFYLTERPFKLSPTSISDLEKQILTLLGSEITNSSPLQATYICFSGVEMSSDEIDEAGWRVVTSD